MIGLILIIITIISNLINLISGAPVVAKTITSRWGHSSTLVNSNIFFIGGLTEGNVPVTEFLRLDVSKSFSTLKPEWLLLDTVGIPKAIGHTAVRGGLNNNQIIIFGGSASDPATAFTNSLFVYDTISGLLTIPQISQAPPQVSKSLNRRYEHSAAISPTTGEMFIYGGMVDESTGSSNSAILQDLWKIDTKTFKSWIDFPLINNSPGLRTSHTASVVDNKMIIIGGMTGDIPRGMNVIHVFDFDTSSWQINTASGDIPESRREHSAVVANKNIIIYGGTDATKTVLYGDVAVLDTNTWSWTIQDTINPPKKRRGHSATLVGANMIVAFGRTDVSADTNIYVLNILNWTWITEYVPMDLLPFDDHSTSTPVGNITNPKVDDGSRDDAKPKLYLSIIILLSVICGLFLIIIISLITYLVNLQRKIEDGSILVSMRFEATQQPPTQPQLPPQPPQPPMTGRNKPNLFLCLGNKSKKDKHYSQQSTDELVNHSTPTSPLSGPSTPHTNTTRFSNGSGVEFGPPKIVRFSNNTITLHQYSPESEGSNQSQLNIEKETDSIKERLAANDLTPRPSYESMTDLSNVRDSRILYVTNFSPEDYEKDDNEKDQDDYQEEFDDDDEDQDEDQEEFDDDYDEKDQEEEIQEEDYERE
jgi:N-acetylneuraminic acid mutarotase